MKFMKFTTKKTLVKLPNVYYSSSVFLGLQHSLNFIHSLIIIFLLFTPVCLWAESRREIAENYRLNGYQEQQKGNLQDALSWYTKAASVDAKYAVVFNDIGLVYEQMQQDNLAEENYLKAIKADEKYLPSYSNLALLYKKRQNLIQAVDYFYKRVELGDPQDPWTIKAKDELKAIYLTSPFFKEKRIKKLARKFDAQLVKEIQEDFDRSVSQANKLHNQGIKFFKAKQYAQAVKAFDQALALTPGNPKIVRSRQRALHELNKIMVHTHVNEAMKLLDKGDTQKAQSQFQQVLTIIPDEPAMNSQK